MEKIRAGELDRRVVLYSVDEDAGDEFAEPSEDLQQIGEVWAAFDPNGGREFFENRQIKAAATATFKIRYRQDVHGLGTKTRAGHDGRIWNVHRVDEIGRREGLLIFASAPAD